jgi:uncharacterized protein YndB with AHSA1/START domain
MSSTITTYGLKLSRRLPAPTTRVYAAWTDPSEVKRWWGPKDFIASGFDANVRLGGTWRSRIVGKDGSILDQGGRYTVVRPDEKLAFTFRWDEPEAADTEVVVTLATEDDATLLTFEQYPFDSDDERRSHQEGWAECLDRLVAHLEGEPP